MENIMVLIYISLMPSDVEYFFTVGHLDVFFAEMSVHVFCPFLDWSICSLGVEFGKLFIYFGYSPFLRYVICKYLLPFCWCLLVLLTVSFAVQKLLILMKSQ